MIREDTVRLMGVCFTAQIKISINIASTSETYVNFIFVRHRALYLSL